MWLVICSMPLHTLPISFPIMAFCWLAVAHYIFLWQVAVALRGSVYLWNAADGSIEQV